MLYGPACVTSALGASPTPSPSKSDQTSSSAQLGFSKNNSFSYQRSRREGCTPFPLAGPAKPHTAAHQ